MDERDVKELACALHGFSDARRGFTVSVKAQN